MSTIECEVHVHDTLGTQVASLYSSVETSIMNNNKTGVMVATDMQNHEFHRSLN